MKRVLTLAALAAVLSLPSARAAEQGYTVPANTPAHIRGGTDRTVLVFQKPWQ